MLYTCVYIYLLYIYYIQSLCLHLKTKHTNMHECLCIHLYGCTHIFIHTDNYIHICTCICMCVCTDIDGKIDIHTFLCVLFGTNAHTLSLLHMHARTRAVHEDLFAALSDLLSGRLCLVWRCCQRNGGGETNAVC